GPGRDVVLERTAGARERGAGRQDRSPVFRSRGCMVGVETRVRDAHLRVETQDRTATVSASEGLVCVENRLVDLEVAGAVRDRDRAAAAGRVETELRPRHRVGAAGADAG